ncbi:hypothetical protein [Devosia yakushimensis]|uniref:hypothetical protein n=1 Tax=Devosia yakushimensis TaxID=470028 RepID=UPI00351A869E
MDGIKPWPMSAMESLPGAYGVMGDDLIIAVLVGASLVPIASGKRGAIEQIRRTAVARYHATPWNSAYGLGRRKVASLPTSFLAKRVSRAGVLRLEYCSSPAGGCGRYWPPTA